MKMKQKISAEWDINSHFLFDYFRTAEILLGGIYVFRKGDVPYGSRAQRQPFYAVDVRTGVEGGTKRSL